MYEHEYRHIIGNNFIFKTHIADNHFILSNRCTNTNVVNFVLGSMELAQVAVTGLLRCPDISLEEELWGIVTHTRVVCKGKEKAKEIRVNISDIQELKCTMCHQLHSSSRYQFQSWVNILFF
ncbi:uncharacterized protein LOC124207961 isoform X2 [Daphnia pulex]|nr:uncharacterized protein LOC124207961 isoform X2 [Daphnia pulex]